MNPVRSHNIDFGSVKSSSQQHWFRRSGRTFWVPRTALRSLKLCIAHTSSPTSQLFLLDPIQIRPLKVTSICSIVDARRKYLDL